MGSFGFASSRPDDCGASDVTATGSGATTAATGDWFTERTANGLMALALATGLLADALVLAGCTLGGNGDGSTMSDSVPGPVVGSISPGVSAASADSRSFTGLAAAAASSTSTNSDFCVPRMPARLPEIDTGVPAGLCWTPASGWRTLIAKAA